MNTIAATFAYNASEIDTWHLLTVEETAAKFDQMILHARWWNIASGLMDRGVAEADAMTQAKVIMFNVTAEDHRIAI